MNIRNFHFKIHCQFLVILATLSSSSISLSAQNLEWSKDDSDEDGPCGQKRCQIGVLSVCGQVKLS